MYKSFTSNKLQDNAESSDTFINKAILTAASYTRTICYKFQSFTIYHLPSWKQIKKWVHLNILFLYVPLIVFLSICLYIYRDLFKVILPLYFSIALWNIYYVHLVWEDINMI